ncbi:thiol-disulfide oxidoreductase DCC family protein [Mangrovicoccus sp. HB161399]|uniref:thiol-disulfide oxidoreductase DCC family protein n=1 Tax=Mangrovicoccus sp. HB161399 TaxID=2720392 RepID=UPI001556E861|nr:DUF393 domain-containing protein [Mangrovicoccus sp. HB161399]
MSGHSDPATVIYNGDCPACAAGIGLHARAARTGALPIRFEDLNACDLARLGLDEDRAARQIHVLKDGVLLEGVPALAALWSQLPGWRWLGRAVLRPALRQAAELLYGRVIAPTVYRRHLRRKRLASGTGAR